MGAVDLADGWALKLKPGAAVPAVVAVFASEALAPAAQRFYAECKRASNRKAKAELGLTLRYPNYRVGLDALFATGDHEGRRV